MSQGQIREEGTLFALINHGWCLVPGADVTAFLQTDLFLVYFLFRERNTVPVQWRSDVKLVACEWSWHSHGSLIPGKLDLKINRSMKMP